MGDDDWGRSPNLQTRIDDDWGRSPNLQTRMSESKSNPANPNCLGNIGKYFWIQILPDILVL
jgi:hypothetical protein